MRAVSGIRIAITLIALTFSPTFFVRTVQAEPPMKSGEILIKFKAGVSGSVRSAILSDLGASRIRAFGRIHAEHDRLTGRTVADAIARYRNHPAVEFIEPNYIVTTLTEPDDPLFSDLWGLHNTGQTGGTPGADIHATEAWDISTGSNSVVVAIIDTGIDYTHPDLAANIFINTAEIPGNGIDDDGNGFVDDVRGWDFVNQDNDPMDDHFHGTHVAGTIGAVGNNGLGVVGVNWSVRLMPLKFLSSGGSGSTADAVAAIEYATMMHVDIMSNSWGGGGFSDALRQAIQNAMDAGILFVAAAGNSSSNNDIFPAYPASYDLDNIVSVASTTSTDNLSGFSNFGATSVDLAAPGSNILSTLPGGTYGLLSGTSMATPHVSGVLALLRARYPFATFRALKEKLLTSVDHVDALAGLMVSGGRANAARAIADPDTIPPSAVTTLHVLDPTSNTIRIEWTATGDDLGSGTAGGYEVRFAPFPLTAENFGTGTLALHPPTPQPPGSIETMEVGNLTSSTLYYIALRVLDDVGNPSPISNVASGTTLGPPTVQVTPSSITESLLSGAHVERSVVLSNVGQGTLDFTITEDRTSAAVIAHDYVPIARGSADPRVGAPATGSGGPDLFGYRWTDSDQPGGPVFDWVEISTIGTPLPMRFLDENFGPVPIGFPFSFYGHVFTELRTCTHGWLSFTNTSTQFSNQPLPNSGAPENLIAAFWDDLNFSGVQRAFSYNDGSRLIIEYKDVPRTAGGGPFTFETILYPNGTIVFQYLTVGPFADGATVGIQNATRDDGLTIAFNTTYVRSGLAVRISRTPEWFHVMPLAGRIHAPGSTTLSVAMDATDLAGGTYTGAVRIQSNDPLSPQTTVPIELAVTGVPDIDVTRNSIDFGNVFVGGTRADTVRVTNRGTQLLHVTRIETTSPAFLASPGSLDLPPSAGGSVIVTFHPGSPMPFSGDLVLQSDDPDEAEIRIPITGTGLIAPDIDVSPSSFAASLLSGEETTRMLHVANTGGSDLTFQIRFQNLTFPEPVPAATTPAHSGSEILAHYEGSRTDTLAAAHSEVRPSPQPGVIPLWKQLQTTLGDSTLIFYDDMEGGANGWTHYSTLPGGLDFWALETTRHHSGSHSWHVQQHAGVGAEALQSPPINLVGYPDALLAMHHWYNFDDCGDPNFEPDGGIVEISTNGGATWVQVRPLPGYPYVLDDICGNPLAFHEAYSHDGGVGNEFVPAVFDLTPFIGSTIRIRFQAGWDCGNCAFNEGWFLDDVMVFSRGSGIASANPSSGTVPAGSSLDVEMGIHTEGLIGGDYSWDLAVLSNDPDEGRVGVPTTLHVTGVQDIYLSPSSIDFGNLFVGLARTETLVVHNVGTDVLHVTHVSSDQASITVIGGTTFPLGPGAHREIPLRFEPSVAGSVSGRIEVTSDDPDQPTASMTVGGVGVLAPVITVAPTSIHEDLFSNESRIRILAVGNTGGSDLQFSLNTRAGATVTVSTLPPLGKGAIDARVGPPVTQGFGGPDQFGYRWADSDQSGGPVFQWVDIESTGTVIPINGDDQTSAPIPIGFLFPYYGATFSTFRACTNGFLSFTSSSASFSNSPLPSFFAPENMLAAFWDDLYVATDSRVLYRNDGARLILVFDHVYSLSGGGPYTFEILLYPSGTILYQYLSMSEPLSFSTVGFQNGTQNDGLTVVYNQAYVHSGLAVRIASANWLTLTPTGGTVPPAGSLPVNAVLDATGLYSGDYGASIDITSNDPVTPFRSVPVSIHIVGVPDLSAAPDSLDFGSLFLGRTLTRSLQVTNVGTDRLIVSGMTAGLPDYTISPSAFSLEPLQSRNVEVAFAATTPGDRTTELRIASNDLDSPAVVGLHAQAVVPPVLGVDPASLTADLYSDEISTQRLTVRNTGGSELDVSVSVGDGVPDPAPGSPVNVPAALRAPTRNRTSPSTGAPVIQSEYGGTNLHFGITPYGEIMPFQFPPGIEHLRVGSFIAGYTVSYLVSGLERTWYTAYESHFGIVPLSYTELENSPARLVVEVLTGTQDGLLLIRRRFTFPRDKKYIRIETQLEAQGTPLTGLIFKEHADWDMDGDFDDDTWDYDRRRNMVYAFDNHYAAIGSPDTPAYMDIFGWDDYTTRNTVVNFPNGPVMGLDGLEVLHFDLGPLGGTQTARVSAAYGAGNDLADLRQVMDEAIRKVTWLTATPEQLVVPAGGQADIEATFTAGKLPSGAYSARIQLETNDPDNAQRFVPTTLHVTATPVLAIAPGSLSFGTIFIGQPSTQSLVARNPGALRLVVTSASVNLTDYTVSPVAFELDPGESTTIAVAFTPSAVGSRNATLTFTSNARNPSLQVALTGAGVIPPILALRPPSIEAAAIPGTSVTKSFLICNDGGSDLTFHATPPGGIVTATSIQPYLYRGKDAPDLRPGVLGSGGPDGFGHLWLDSDDLGGPIFGWVDISTTGTQVPFTGIADDLTLGPFPMGFEFPFYDATFHEFNVCTNGFISFTSHSASYSYQPLPSDGFEVPENLVAPLWRDLLYIDVAGSSIYYKYDGARLIIQFNNMIPRGRADLYSFEIFLEPDGDIIYQYLVLGSGLTSGSVGIQNAARDDGLNIAFNTSYPHASQAIRIAHPIHWITVNPLSGTVPPGGCAALSVRLDSRDLPAGDHAADVRILSNDPAHLQSAEGALFHVGITDAAFTDVDPNTLNLHSNGRFITARTELPPSLDPARVVLSTVRFQGIPPTQTSLPIDDFNHNGIPDLSFTFDRASVEAILPEGDDIPVLMTGEVENTTFFAARDTIRVIRPHMKTPNGGEILISGSTKLVTWTEPSGWMPDFASLYYSLDLDSTWMPINTHIVGTSYPWAVPSVAAPSARIRVYLYDSEGVMGYDSSDLPFRITGTTAVDVAEGGVPRVHALFQNVPNPFNPTTWIKFELPSASRAQLEVFSVDGRRVRTLLDQPLPAGRYRLVWDGRNDQSRPVASGVYLYRIRAGSYVSSRRMLLLK
jgi:subtilisin family serine protease